MRGSKLGSPFRLWDFAYERLCPSPPDNAVEPTQSGYALTLKWLVEDSVTNCAICCQDMPAAEAPSNLQGLTSCRSSLFPIMVYPTNHIPLPGECGAGHCRTPLAAGREAIRKWAEQGGFVRSQGGEIMSLCLSRVYTTGALSVTIVSSSIQPTAPAFVAGLHTPGSLGQ